MFLEPRASLNVFFLPLWAPCTSGKSWPAQSQWPLGCCELRAEKAIFCLDVELMAQDWHNKPELLHEERHLPAAAELRQRFVAAKSLL